MYTYIHQPIQPFLAGNINWNLGGPGGNRKYCRGNGLPRSRLQSALNGFRLGFRLGFRVWGLGFRVSGIVGVISPVPTAGQRAL